MKEGDFIDFKNQLSVAKDTNYHYLSDVAEVQFRRGTTKLFWKENHVTAKYKNGEFLQKTFRETVENGDLLPRKKNRGVNTSKLNDILVKTGPLIPGECLLVSYQKI